MAKISIKSNLLKVFFDKEIVFNLEDILVKDIIENLVLIDYNYGTHIARNDAILVFSSTTIDEKDKIVVYTKNPKYSMYYFIFECLLKDKYTSDQNAYYELNNSRINKKVELQDTLIGLYNSIGSDPFSFYEYNGKRYHVKALFSTMISKGVRMLNNNTISLGIFRDTVIGEGTILDSNICISHDVVIGKNNTITSGVSVGGFVKTGDNCYFGMNSTIRNGITLGHNVTVGMGAVVTKSYGDNVVLVGNPARPKKCN